MNDSPHLLVRLQDDGLALADPADDVRGLQNRAKTNQSGELTAMHRINRLLRLWERRFEGLVADGKRSPTSLDTYGRVLKNHFRPAIGEPRIGEASTPTHRHRAFKDQGPRRPNGQNPPLIRKATKSRAGQRILHLPN